MRRALDRSASQVGLEPADLPAVVATQVEAVDEHAVRVFQDGQVLDAGVDADGLLLGDAQACGLLGRVRHARVAVSNGVVCIVAGPVLVGSVLS
ncbi:hypothetical protein [Amycolatopsis sp. NPDC004378]